MSSRTDGKTLRKIAANFPAVRSCQVKKVRAERREEGRTRDDKERGGGGSERERAREGNYTQLLSDRPILRLLQAKRSGSTSVRILTEDNAHQ